jgi:transcriptional regulator with XRE-family HTH domain
MVTLSAHRDAMGMTQAGVAKRIFVNGYGKRPLSQSMISLIENGQRPISPALHEAFARAVGVAPADLHIDIDDAAEDDEDADDDELPERVPA